MRNNWGRRDRGTRSWTAPNACPLSGSHTSLTGWRLSNWVSAHENLPRKPQPRISPWATLGALIMTHKIRMSLASGATTHPFQEADLEELRAILGPRHLHERCPGQPFLLDLVSHLASLSGDPDWEFPLTLKEVPLGVSDPTLTSPRVWPTKEELKGEAWLGEDPPPQWLMITTQRLNSLPRKSNQPFTRNEPCTWWTGPSLAPRRQRGAAANRRNSARAPLQGLMSRTRSGRSTKRGSKRAHPGSHGGEDHRTDGWRLHWLRTAADHPHLLRAPSSGTDEEPRDVHQPAQGQSPGG